MALLHSRLALYLDLLHLFVLLVDFALALVDDALKLFGETKGGHLLEIVHVLDLVCQQIGLDVLVLDQVFEEKVLQELKLQVYVHIDPLFAQRTQVRLDDILTQIYEVLQAFELLGCHDLL